MVLLLSEETVTICVVISVAASCYQLITRLPFVNLTLIVTLESGETAHTVPSIFNTGPVCQTNICLESELAALLIHFFLISD